MPFLLPLIDSESPISPWPSTSLPASAHQLNYIPLKRKNFSLSPTSNSNYILGFPIANFHKGIELFMCNASASSSAMFLCKPIWFLPHHYNEMYFPRLPMFSKSPQPTGTDYIYHVGSSLYYRLWFPFWNTVFHCLPWYKRLFLPRCSFSLHYQLTLYYSPLKYSIP